MTGPDQFDMHAAGLRRSQSDIKAFVEALAVRLEGALPGRVEIDRKRDGLLSKTSHVRRISFNGDKAVYELTNHGSHLTALRSKLVRGVTISSGEISTAEWLEAVKAELATLSNNAEAASQVLEDFL